MISGGIKVKVDSAYLSGKTCIKQKSVFIEWNCRKAFHF